MVFLGTAAISPSATATPAPYAAFHKLFVGEDRPKVQARAAVTAPLVAEEAATAVERHCRSERGGPRHVEVRW